MITQEMKIASNGALTLTSANPNAIAALTWDATGKPNKFVATSSSGGTQLVSISGTGITATLGASAGSGVILEAWRVPATGSPSASIVNPQQPTLSKATAPFNYQTFGSWWDSSSTPHVQGWFSYGIPTTSSLPTTGSARYAGVTGGNYIDTSGKIYQTTATLTAVANFGSKPTITVNTSNTYMTPNSGGTSSANSSLNLSGKLTVTGNNFTGAVNATGLSGNATGRFYGPGTSASTKSSAINSPAEVGGTYALGGTAGTLIGAFGGVVQ